MHAYLNNFIRHIDQVLTQLLDKTGLILCKLVTLSNGGKSYT